MTKSRVEENASECNHALWKPRRPNRRRLQAETPAGVMWAITTSDGRRVANIRCEKMPLFVTRWAIHNWRALLLGTSSTAKGVLLVAEIRYRSRGLSPMIAGRHPRHCGDRRPYSFAGTIVTGVGVIVDHRRD